MNWEMLNNAIITCQRCPRLVAWREEMARIKRRVFQDQEYWGRPVPGFGDENARLLVVGLAPGAHGSNRTGRMFTGDASGDFLYGALHRAKFANQPKSIHCGDDLRLQDVFITAVCRCVPPENKPVPAEILACRPFLDQEILLLGGIKGIIALGRIAFDQVSGLVGGGGKTSLQFSHGAFYHPNPARPWLLASYHPSRQNTQTGRLTPPMFDSIWEKARFLLDGYSAIRSENFLMAH